METHFQWREVAQELEGVIRIGAVNCQEEWNLCRQQGIHSYPSLVLYPTVSGMVWLVSVCLKMRPQAQAFLCTERQWGVAKTKEKLIV